MDNLTWTPEELRILQLDAKVEIEFIARFSQGWNEHLSLLHDYSGRHEHNYSAEAIDRSIKYQDRFNIGALKIIVDGELSRSLMLEQHRGWILLSRLISHNHPRLPILTAHGVDAVTNLEKEYNCQGIFATLNKQNRMYLNCIDTDRFTMFNGPELLYTKHRSAIQDIKRLDSTRMFMNTAQYILYRGDNVEDIFK